MKSERIIRLLIGFDGTDFNGWQRQKHDISIQGEIEKRLAVMTNSAVDLHGAGRTDAGVHAEGMTAHFATKSPITCQAFLKGLNSMLPYSIRIFAVDEMDPEFHSRFSAKGKQYRYSLFTGPVMPPCHRLYAVHVPSPLNFNIMRACLEHLKGTHDFSSFENAGSRDKDKESRKGAVRTITKAELTSTDPHHHTFTFIGEGFLRHMVRNMVGTILEAGRGKIGPDEFKRALDARDRSAGGPTAPPHGLTLVKVFY